MMFKYKNFISKVNLVNSDYFVMISLAPNNLSKQQKIVILINQNVFQLL